MGWFFVCLFYLFRQHLHYVALAGLKLTAVAKDDLKLLVLLLPPPKCLNYRIGLHAWLSKHVFLKIWNTMHLCVILA